MSGRRWTLGLRMLGVVAASCRLLAQDATGSLAGEVLDATNAAVRGADVTLQRKGTPFTRRTTTGPRGEFRFSDLPPALYSLHVEAAGMSPASSLVTVNAAASAVRIVLVPAPMKQSVLVTGEASSITTQPVDGESTVLGGVITARDLGAFPLAERSFANIAYLAPGTEPVEPSDPTKARITAVSVGGSSGLNNVLSVDGADNSDDYIGGFLQNFSPSAIGEFNFRTTQEDADTGRTVGGSVVISTRRGSNDWHGEADIFERAAALNARFPIENPAPLPKQPFSRQNYVGALGGPVVKNKLWFFSSFEFVNEHASIAYSPASLTQFHALAALASDSLVPGVTSISVPYNVPVPFRDFLSDFRLDWAQSSRSQWFARLAADSYVTDNALLQQGTLPSTGATSHNNYGNAVIGNQFVFGPNWLASLTLDASLLHLTMARNSNLGYALAFPFSSTYQTISGFETFGDNQFVTPITAFPILRNQEKYQARYAITRSTGRHSPSFGVDFIHEPVLSGALAANAESLTIFPQDPTFYLTNPAQFTVDRTCTPAAGLEVTPGTSCTSVPAGNGSFSQNVQRLGLYALDSWRITPRLTLNYGIRYDTTFGLFIASGQSQLANPALSTLQTLRIPLFAAPAAPHDYRGAIAPRLGLAYALDRSRSTILRAGFGLFYDDLAQVGWVTAFQAVNEPPGLCAKPGDPGCLPGAASGGAGALIDPGYKTPYALHATAGIEHAFSRQWILSSSWVHETGMHGYRRYDFQAGYTLTSPLYPADPAIQQQYVPNISVFRSDNRSVYDALFVHLQGNLNSRLSLIVNYTLSRAYTWGCVLGELFDYVNGVCDPRAAFRPGDYGPSGENVPNRIVVAGIYHAPAGFELSFLSQAESARPFTMTTPVDVNGFGDFVDDRAVVNGVQTAMDQFRGAPFIETDLRVTRPFHPSDRWTVAPFIEFFNLFNRNNPGANYVTNLAALPTPVNNLANATAFCLNPSCTQTQPITSLNQLRVPAGALGDFFGPGTTVGIPFAAQLGLRVTF